MESRSTSSCTTSALTTNRMHKPGRLARGLDILKMSAQVMMKHKKLVVFPLITGVFFLLIVAVFFFPAVFYTTGYSLGQSEHWKVVGERVTDVVSVWNPRHHDHVPLTAYVRLFSLYVSFLICSTFFNVAFYHEIMEALAWENVSIRRGLAFARQRLLPIVMWSLFAGTIGFVIRQLAERLGVIGALVLRFIGVTWSVASVFAIPVMVRETSANPVTLLRQSAKTIRKTWGESLTGLLGMDVVMIGLMLVLLLISFGIPFGMMMLGVRPDIAFVSGVGLFVSSLIAGQLFSGMISNIFRCALYIYASEGVVPAPYSAELMESAWRVKKRS